VLHSAFADAELTQFMVLLDETPAAELRSAMAAALDASTLLTFAGLAERAALATDADLTAMSTAAAEVASAPAPNLSLAASPELVASGATSRLSWASTAAQSCLASGDWSGEQAVEGAITVGPLAASATYTLSCAGLGGTVTQSVTVDVQAPAAAPTVTLSANPAQITAGGASTLNWSSTNATSCVASGGWNGSRGTSGSAAVGPLSVSTAFVLTCSGSGGSASTSTNVTVTATPAPAPTLTFSANPTSVAYNAGTTLSWSAANATSCSASGDWSGSRTTSGNSTQNGLTANRTYTLTCQGAGGTIARTVNVAVGPAPVPAPTLTFSGNPTSVAYNGSTSLSWSAGNATSCAASGDWSGNRATFGNSTRSNLTANKTYTLTCQGAGGSIAATVNITVGAPPPTPAPTLTFTGNPTSVAYNASSTLSWSTTNASSCTASGDWSGSRGTAGSATQSGLTANRTYTLTCQGAGGTVVRTVNITVAPAPTPAPTLTFSGNPTSVAYDGSTVLSWSSTNATGCTASGDWSGSRATSGSATQANLTANRTYTLTCQGAGGSIARTVNVAVGAPPNPAPTLTLTATPTSVAYNGSTTLNWSASNATTCTASGGWSGNQNLSGSSVRSNLTANTSFTLACSGAGGTVTQTASVTVAPSPAPTATLTANPPWIAPNTNSTLSWTSANATSCTASGGWSGSKATSGSQSVGPLTQDTTYTLTCSGTGGNVVSMTSVSIRSARLTWTAPTQNVDGSPLTNLAGYKIYYGNTPGSSANVVTVNGGATTERVVSLSPGTWYFSITAFNTANEESARTGNVSKVVQ
jgi:hypothetical protein